jgi:hypothetical protein
MKKRDFLKTTGAALSGAAFTTMAASKAGAATGDTSEAQLPAEREWARALARHVSQQLPEAISQVPGLDLSPQQVQELRRAYENTLITNMGCTPTTPSE